VAGVGRDGQLGRHQAAVNDRQTRSKRQQQRQEARANSGSSATEHGPVTIARTRTHGNPFLVTRSARGMTRGGPRSRCPRADEH
jgi:hypothetical protein